MTDESKLDLHPWPDILKRERREMLVDELLFTRGITTLVAPSGGGKSTLAMSVALTVATGGVWAGKVVRPRPVLLVADEGQDDLRRIYVAWRKLHPSDIPQGGFSKEAVDLSDDAETDRVLGLITGYGSPVLIVIDALADMIDDDDKSNVNRVYRNIRRIARTSNSAVLILWDSKRGPFETALRKSDIVVNVDKFDSAAGIMQLTHIKRRGGAKRKFAYEVKLLELGYPRLIPIVLDPVEPEPRK